MVASSWRGELPVAVRVDRRVLIVDVDATLLAAECCLLLDAAECRIRKGPRKR